MAGILFKNTKMFRDLPSHIFINDAAGTLMYLSLLSEDRTLCCTALQIRPYPENTMEVLMCG